MHKSKLCLCRHELLSLVGGEEAGQGQEKVDVQESNEASASSSSSSSSECCS